MRSFKALSIIFVAVLIGIVGSAPAVSALATVPDKAWRGAPTITGDACNGQDKDGEDGYSFKPTCRSAMATHYKSGWVYVAGAIDNVVSGDATKTYTQFRNMFRYNPVSGEVDSTFAPKFYTDTSTTTTPDYSMVPAGMVRRIASGPGDSIFVAGDFRQVGSSSNGKLYTQRALAKINTVTGDVDRTFKPNIGCIALSPQPCTIFTVAYIPSLNYVMLGGLFNKANGVAETGFVILDGTTGATIPNTRVTLKVRLDQAADIKLKHVQPHVRAIAQNPLNDKEFFLAGHFAEVGAYPNTFQAYRYGAFKMQFSSTGVLTVSSWNARVALSASRPAGEPANASKGAPNAGRCHQKVIWARQMAYSPDGQYIIFGSSGLGAQDVYPAMCDTLTVFRAGPDANGVYDTYQAPVVYNHTPSDTIQSVCTLGKSVYMGGHFRGTDFVMYRNGLKVGGVDYYTTSDPNSFQIDINAAAPYAHFGIAAINLDAADTQNFGRAEPSWNLTQLVNTMPTPGKDAFPWPAKVATTTGRGYGWNAATCVPASQSPTGKDMVIMGGDGTVVNGDKTRSKLAQFNAL